MRDPLCHFKMAPLQVSKELRTETNYQATGQVLLNKMLKPFAHPTVPHHSTTFQERQQNRMDVEANVEAVCQGL